jgi:hypothetical protein
MNTPNLPQGGAPNLPLLVLAAQCSTAAAGLLTGSRAASKEMRFLAQGLLKMAGDLVECSFLAAPYLWHVQVTCWQGVEYWYNWLCADELTAEQDAAFLAIAQAWSALLEAWDASEVAA